MDDIDLEKFRVAHESRPVTASTQSLPRHKKGERFLCGPIPLDWLARAGCLPGKALHVAIAIWFLAGVTKTATVRLQRTLLDDLGISRKSGYRAICAMENAGLIEVIRGCGRRPFITILEVRAANGNGKKGGHMTNGGHETLY